MASSELHKVVQLPQNPAPRVVKQTLLVDIAANPQGVLRRSNRAQLLQRFHLTILRRARLLSLAMPSSPQPLSFLGDVLLSLQSL
jgi:hypothetical protein